MLGRSAPPGSTPSHESWTLPLPRSATPVFQFVIESPLTVTLFPAPKKPCELPPGPRTSTTGVAGA